MSSTTRTINRSRMHYRVRAVDLFCGAGGLTHGLIKSGVDVKAGVDCVSSCRYAYSHNNNAIYLQRDIRNLHGDELSRYLTKKKKFHEVTLLAGCAPCQTFSSYNRKANSSDPRWHLLGEFLRLVRETNPDLVTMENVPELARKDIFLSFVDGLKTLGYGEPSWKIVLCSEYGLPQHRRRLVLLASKLGPIEILNPKQFGAQPATVRDAIGSLPRVAAGAIDAHDPLHRTFALSDLNLKRIQASKPGGTWKDWPEELRCPCHRKNSGSSYKSVYGRMCWDLPSPTMTTQFVNYGTGRFGHPEQDRALTLREAALLQSFPADYQFVAPGQEIIISHIAKMIGNAVPVVIGELIGQSIFAHLKSL